MATATVEITLPGLTGFTLSLQLYTYQTDTLVHTIALTEATLRKGTYSGTQVSPTPGLYHARCVEGTTTRGEGYVRVADAAVVHTVVGVPDPVLTTVIGTPAGASIAVDIAAVKIDTGNLVTRITSTLFTGITSLAQWLGLIAGKQVGNSTARTEIRATGTGSGTYDETLHSLEAHDTGTGNGPRTIRVTVTDGVNPIQNATIVFSEGVTVREGDTDVNGIRDFGLSDATWNYVVAKDGYTSVTGTHLVDINETPLPITLTLTVITPATNPSQSTLSITCYGDDLLVEPGAIIRLVMVKKPDNDVGRAYDTKVKVLTANGSGIVTTTVVRLAVYTIQRGDEITNLIRVTIPDTPTCTVESVLGKEEL